MISVNYWKGGDINYYHGNRENTCGLIVSAHEVQEIPGFSLENIFTLVATGEDFILIQINTIHTQSTTASYLVHTMVHLQMRISCAILLTCPVGVFMLPPPPAL